MDMSHQASQFAKSAIQACDFILSGLPASEHFISDLSSAIHNTNDDDRAGEVVHFESHHIRKKKPKRNDVHCRNQKQQPPIFLGNFSLFRSITST
jgi:hypothetical protein